MYCMSLVSLVLLMETANYLFRSSIPLPVAVRHEGTPVFQNVLMKYV